MPLMKEGRILVESFFPSPVAWEFLLVCLICDNLQCYFMSAGLFYFQTPVEKCSLNALLLSFSPRMFLYFVIFKALCSYLISILIKKTVTKGITLLLLSFCSLKFCSCVPQDILYFELLFSKSGRYTVCSCKRMCVSVLYIHCVLIWFLALIKRIYCMMFLP